MAASSTRIARRHRRADGGAAAVEFALVSVLLFTLVFGIIQYGFYFWAAQVGTSAVRDAARYSAVGAKTCGNGTTDNELVATVRNQLGAAAVGDTPASVARAYDAPPTTGGNVTITVTFQALNIGLPFVPLPNGGRVTTTADARIESVTAKSVNCP